jgi:tetratricopeptide (TPR) repeat protein
MQYILVTKDVSVIPQAVDAGEKSRAADPGSITQDIGLAYMFANLGELPAAKRHLDRAAEDARTAHPSASLLRALQTLLDLVVDKNRPLIADMNAILVNAAANPNLMRDDCDFSDIWNTLGLFRHRTNDIPGSLNALNKAVQLCPQNGQTHANYASVLLAYGETHYAEQQLDALRQLHDLRYGGILRELERQLDEAEKKRITGNDGSAVAPAGANH